MRDVQPNLDRNKRSEKARRRGKKKEEQNHPWIVRSLLNKISEGTNE
jgi:hypothetical protein